MRSVAKHFGMWVGLVLVGGVISGCVRYSYQPEGGGQNQRWSDDPILDDQMRTVPPASPRVVAPPTPPKKPSYSRGLAQMRQTMLRYRKVIAYCQNNHRKVVDVMHRLRRTMYFVQDQDEWRYYQGLKKQFSQHLVHNQQCIRKFRMRLVQLQQHYARVIRQHQAPYRYGNGYGNGDGSGPSPSPSTGRWYAQRGPWQPAVPPSSGEPDVSGRQNPRGLPHHQPMSPEPTQPESKKPEAPVSPPDGLQGRNLLQPSPGLQRRIPRSFPEYRPPRFSTPPGGGGAPDDLMKPVPSAPGSGAPPGHDSSTPLPKAPQIGGGGAQKLRSPTVISPKVEQGPHGSALRPIPETTPVPAPMPEATLPNIPTPSDPDDAQAITQWRTYCAGEVKRYPMVQAVRSVGEMVLKAAGSVRVHRFKHVSSESMRPMLGAGSRWIVLGSSARYSQAHCSDRSYSLWDTQRQTRIETSPAVTGYLLRHRHLVPWFLGKKHAAVEEELVSFQPQHGRGGVLLRSPMPSFGKRYNYVYLVWDLKSRRILKAWTLGLPGCFGAYRSIGTEPNGKAFYYLQSEKAVNADCTQSSISPASSSAPSGASYRLMALNLDSGSRRTVAQFASAHPRLEAIVATQDFSRIAIVPYTESDRAQGQSIVIHTETGQVLRFPAPTTPYGVTFSADEEFLMIYSAKAGKIVRFQMATGQRQEFASYPLGHALGLSLDGKRLFLVFHSGVEVRDAITLKKLQFLPHRPMMGNVRFIHVGGSAVYGNTLFIKNGEDLFIRRTP